MGRLKYLALVVALALPVSAFAETMLLMAEERGCPWCARWNEEVGDAYAKTPEGRAAPLRRFDIHGPLPDGIDLDGRVRFTPTFILVRDGKEVARMEGYPGEDFFWGLLARMFRAADIPLPATESG